MVNTIHLVHVGFSFVLAIDQMKGIEVIGTTLFLIIWQTIGEILVGVVCLDIDDILFATDTVGLKSYGRWG